jgi:hypothetical protein
LRRAGLPVIGLASLLTPFPALALVCLWVLLAAEMPGRTRVRSAIAAVVATFALNAAALTLLAVLQVPCRPRLLLAVLLLLGLLHRTLSPRLPARPLADATDLWALGFGLATFAVLAFPLLGASTGRTISLLSQTTDGGTHVAIVRAIARHLGYIQFDQPAGASPGAEHYPSAWHGNVWIASDLLLGSHPSSGSFIRLVAVAAFAGYALLSTVAANIALNLAPVAIRGRWVAALSTLSVLALGTLVGFGLFFVQLSSYTQIWGLIAVLVLIDATSADLPPKRSVALVAGCCLAVMQSWYLLAPLIGAAAVVAIEQARPPRKLLLTATLLTGLLSLFPVLTGPHGTQVDVPGPTLLPTIGGVLGLLIATGAGIGIIVTTRQHKASARALVAATVASLLTMVALVAKQGFVAGAGVTYYGAKILLSTFLLGAIAAAAAAPLALSRGAQTLRKGMGFVCCLGVACGAVSTAGWTVPPRTTMPSGYLAPATLDAIYARHPHELPRNTEIWIGDGCDRVTDMIASKWPYDTGLGWKPEIQAALNAYAISKPHDVSMIETLLRDPDVKILELYVHHECDPQAVAALLRDPKVVLLRVP